MKVTNINIDQVSQFSSRDRRFLLENEQYSTFQKYPSEYDSFEQVIADRNKYISHRDLVSSVVQEQYNGVTSSSKTLKHISALESDSTFTIVTAHQPSLLTGPLYYVYKILSAIKLAERLQGDYPDKHFVPVFIIGSEDHDFEEINHFHLFGKKIEWKEERSGGPVGNYPIHKLNSVIDQTLEILGDSSKVKELLLRLTKALPHCKSYDDFAFHITHLLFDKLGLVILRMSHAKLKRAFIPIIMEEIINRPSKAIVTKTQEAIKEQLGFESQAFAREINFFYLGDHERNRIEYNAGYYHIVGTDLRFTESEFINEIENCPEKFSPNVITRPLFQEYILPNLAYIGGGGELAYWTERQSQFDHFKVSFPMLIRRTSGMIVTPSNQKQIDNLGLAYNETFDDEQRLVNSLLEKSDSPDYDLSRYKQKLEQLFTEISQDVKKIDPTLEKTAQSELAKSSKSIDYLESKLKKAIKQKESIQLNRLSKMKAQLFPKGLQERHDNIFQYLSTYGDALIEDLYEYCDPFNKTMKVFLM